MKTKLVTTLATCAALAVSASLALAQTGNKAGKGKPPSGKMVKATEVMGAKLFNQNGENIGEVKDIVFDEKTGGVTHCMLAIGGWLGIGENITVVPAKFVRPSKDRIDEFVLHLDKAKLTPEMSFKPNNAPELTEAWFKESYARFNMPAKPGVTLIRASTAVGAELFNQQGNDIGEIQNLLVHPNAGKVAYATCEVDEYATAGNNLTNVPWNLVRQSKKDTKGFVVNADKAKLKGAKYFSNNDWPDYNNETWHDGLYTYYDTDPFWTDTVAN